MLLDAVLLGLPLGLLGGAVGGLRSGRPVATGWMLAAVGLVLGLLGTGGWRLAEVLKERGTVLPGALFDAASVSGPSR